MLKDGLSTAIGSKVKKSVLSDCSEEEGLLSGKTLKVSVQVP